MPNPPPPPSGYPGDQLSDLAELVADLQAMSPALVTEVSQHTATEETFAALDPRTAARIGRAHQAMASHVVLAQNALWRLHAATGTVPAVTAALVTQPPPGPPVPVLALLLLAPDPETAARWVTRPPTAGQVAEDLFAGQRPGVRACRAAQRAAVAGRERDAVVPS